REKRAMRQAMMSGGSVAIEPQRSGLSPFKLNARFTSADFFAMFDVPLRYGQAWSGTSDERHERVAVIS
ncbi:ABC transporter ATP-binding protein, partial [Xanthomonas vasicola pv. vasculorum]